MVIGGHLWSVMSLTSQIMKSCSKLVCDRSGKKNPNRNEFACEISAPNPCWLAFCLLIVVCVVKPGGGNAEIVIDG